MDCVGARVPKVHHGGGLSSIEAGHSRTMLRKPEKANSTKGDRGKMAGRYQGYQFIRDENDGAHVGFEVYWQHEGWFWRPLLTLDGESVGPFTKSGEAYQSALASKPGVRPR